MPFGFVRVDWISAETALVWPGVLTKSRGAIPGFFCFSNVPREGPQSAIRECGPLIGRDIKRSSACTRADLRRNILFGFRNKKMILKTLIG
jgi:hypothetical protein